MGKYQYIRLPAPGRLPKLGIYPNVGIGIGVGVGTIKMGRYPCCCWYQNNGVNTQMSNVGAYKAAARLLVPEQRGKYPKNMVGIGIGIGVGTGTIKAGWVPV